jgi:hypothetical protein
LAGFEEFGDPTRAVFEALASYLRGDVVFFRVVFDFADLGAVKKSIMKMVKELEGPVHQGYALTRFHITKQLKLKESQGFRDFLSP